MVAKDGSTIIKNGNAVIKMDKHPDISSGTTLDGIDLFADNTTKVYPVLSPSNGGPIAGAIYPAGEYLMYRNYDNLTFVTSKLEHALDVKIPIGIPYNILYYPAIGYSITTINRRKYLTKFYDTKLKFTHECECKPEELYGVYRFWSEYVYICGDFINIITGERKRQVTVWHSDDNEIIAECDPSSQTINFFWQNVVFSEKECAVCFNELKERYMAVPCGHLNTCLNCLKDTEKCPICRAEIIMMIKAIL